MDEFPTSKKREIKIPFSLKFALTWTLFFAIIGIAIQSIRAQAFIFKEFFAAKYVEWFAIFRDLNNILVYPDMRSFLIALLNDWYYFFYTAGLLSLIWAVIDIIVNFKIIIRGAPKKSEQPEPPKKTEIDNLLEVGFVMLNRKDFKGAEKIYSKLKKLYHSQKKPDSSDYRKIIFFYDKLLEKTNRKS